MSPERSPQDRRMQEADLLITSWMPAPFRDAMVSRRASAVGLLALRVNPSARLQICALGFVVIAACSDQRQESGQYNWTYPRPVRKHPNRHSGDSAAAQETTEQQHRLHPAILAPVLRKY